MTDLPQLDPRNEEDLVVDVIDNFPVQITDRNRWTPAVKIVEGLGVFYAMLLYYLNKWSLVLQLRTLALLGITPLPATSATVELRFTKQNQNGSITIPAGTVVKTSHAADAVRFTTDIELIIPDLTLQASVMGTAVEAGTAGNISQYAATLFDTPITGIGSVVNSDAAIGGADEEPRAEMQARAPLATRALERAITNTDFEYFALLEPQVKRVKTKGEAGALGIFYFADDLNATNNNALTAAIKTEVESRTLDGVLVTVFQPQPAIIAFPTIEIEVRLGYSVTEVRQAVIDTLIHKINVLNTYNSDGTLKAAGYPWGAILYANELVSAFDLLPGVERVGDIQFKIANAWAPQVFGPTSVLISQDPLYDGSADFTFGMIHFDETQPLAISEL